MVIVYLLLFPKPAYAYLDPGTGSYIFQFLIAFFFGAIFALKLFWKNIKETIRKIFRKKHPLDEKK